MGCGGLWAEAGNGSRPRERPEVSDVAGAGLAGGRPRKSDRSSRLGTTRLNR